MFSEVFLIVYGKSFRSQPEDVFIKEPKHVAVMIFFNCIHIIKVVLDCKIIYFLLMLLCCHPVQGLGF